MKFSYIKYNVAPILLTSSLVMSGCASIVNGGNEKFTVNSKPTSASLTVDGTQAGTTPTQISLTRKQDHVVKLNLVGYQQATIPLRKTISGWVFGNIIFGGVIGVAVDAIDGAMYKLTPQQLNEYAAKAKIRYKEKTHTLTIILVRNGDKKWYKIGQLKKA